MTVESWGAGRPDYMKAVISSRPSIIEQEGTQIKWDYTNTYAISSESSTTATVYTVPSDYNLALGLIDISADNSCINKLRVLRGTTTIVEFQFDMHGHTPLTPMTGQQLTEGENLNIEIWNNDSVEVNFVLVLSGVLEIIKEVV